jgi:hypothetical protein
LHVESRTYLQCRQKYYRQSAALSTAADETADPLADKIVRWNFACDGVLVQKLRMLGVHDEADIEWKLLRDEELPWPQAKIHDAYKRLRKHVPMADEKSFEDIVQGMEEYVNERNEKRSKRNSTGVRKAKADALTMTPAAVGDDEDQGYYEDHHYAQEEQQYYDAEGAVEYELEAGIAYPPKHEEEDELQPSSEAEKPVQKKKKEKVREVVCLAFCFVSDCASVLVLNRNARRTRIPSCVHSRRRRRRPSVMPKRPRRLLLPLVPTRRKNRRKGLGQSDFSFMVDDREFSVTVIEQHSAFI